MSANPGLTTAAVPTHLNIAPSLSAIKATAFRTSLKQTTPLGMLLRFHLDAGLVCHQGQGLLLGILGVDLNDGNVAGAGAYRFDHQAEQGAAAADARSVRLPGGGD